MAMHSQGIRQAGLQRVECAFCSDHYPSLKVQSERIHVHTGNILAVVCSCARWTPRI